MKTLEIERKAGGTLYTFRGGGPGIPLYPQPDGTLSLSAGAPPTNNPPTLTAAGTPDGDDPVNAGRQQAADWQARQLIARGFTPAPAPEAPAMTAERRNELLAMVGVRPRE